MIKDGNHTETSFSSIILHIIYFPKKKNDRDRQKRCQTFKAVML